MRAYLIVFRLVVGLVILGASANVLSAMHDPAAARCRTTTTRTVSSMAVRVPSSSEDSVTPSYQHGAWHISGTVVPALAEDDYVLDYHDGAWWLTPAPGHLGMPGES